MRRSLRPLAIAIGTLLGVVAFGFLALWIRYGGGGDFEDRTSDPLLSGSALQLVADLELPPGNIAVSETGRVFFTFHPEAGPEVNVAELVGGAPVPYPDPEFQPTGSHALRFQSALSLRVDRQGRLWVLDNANHGLGQPRILAFGLETGQLVHHHDFPSEIAGIGSHLNDFQVAPDGKLIYIADASIVAKTPALVVYDVERRRSRRLLEGHESVSAEPFVPVVNGRRMVLFGVVAIRPGVDSIALDRRGEWLYFGAVTAQQLYRVRAEDLRDEGLSEVELGERVEAFGAKTMSDGITTDLADGVYLSDPEHSAVLRIGPDRELRTLIKDPRLRWPDGFSYGPDGWLYVTCSALHHVIGRSRDHVRNHAPYQIYRFRPGELGLAGH